MTSPDPLLDAAWRTEVHRLHRSILPTSLASSAVMGGCVALLLWDSAARVPLAWWSLGLVITILIRFAVGRLPFEPVPGGAQGQPPLRRHRLGYALHGVVWGLAGLLFPPLIDPQPLSLLVCAIVALGVGALILTAFDVPAGAAFAAPATLPVIGHLLVRADGSWFAWWMAALLVLGAALVSALRTQRVVRESVRARLGEQEHLRMALRSNQAAERAQRELARTHRLLPLLIEHTQQGFWQTDAAGLTTHVNPAMCRLLGRERDAVIGRPMGAFIGEADCARLQAQPDPQTDGGLSGFEIAVQRPDGTLRHCHCTPTPLVDGDGTLVGSVSLWTDITARKQAEDQLRVTTENLARKTRELELTLDSIEQGIVSMDAHGKVEVYNRQVLQLLDLPEHLLGPDSTYDDVVRFQASKGDLQADHGFVDVDGQRRYFQGGRSHAPAVYVRRLANGRAIEVRTRQMPGGGLVRTFADVTDYVDAQQALRDGEAELRALLAAFPGYISAIDQDLIYAYVNDRFAAVLGVAAADICGRSVTEVLGEERARHSLELARKAATLGPQVASVEYPATAQRERLALEVTYVAGLARANGRQTFYAFGQDVTARKAAEEALVAARDAAESASRAKSEFLASMSHELRTPLNAILGFSEMFRQDASLPAPAREGAAEVERAGQHLLALVDDLIDLARIEAGRLELQLERVDLGALARQCLTLVEPLARKRGITLRGDIEGHLHVVADLLRTRQALLNLLSNAIKYNRDQGQVHVRVALHEGEVRASVVDTGEGIAPALQARLFNSFDRLGAERGKVEGAGIGLVITQRLVQAMGGRIGVESEPGVGSVFWVQFPQAPRPARELP